MSLLLLDEILKRISSFGTSTLASISLTCGKAFIVDLLCVHVFGLFPLVKSEPSLFCHGSVALTKLPWMFF